MFSKELEEVIDAALADGVITDKERAVLHKRAQVEGVDPDELDIVIDGRLAKAKKETDWLKPAPPQNLMNQKHGNVLKCPSCGAQVISGSAVCPECGFAFINVTANSSVERLQEKLDEFNRRQEQRADNRSITGGLAHNIGRIYGMDGTLKHKMDIISTFPVPNTRGDLLEFLTMLQAKADATGPKNGMNMSHEENLSYAYWLLYTNCINKAKISFSKDKDFEPYFSAYDANLAKTKGLIGYLRRNPKMGCLIGGICFYIILMIIMAIAINN